MRQKAYMMDKDVEINCIDRTLRGDHAAFAELVNEYKDFVFTLVLQIVRQRGLAEEVAQDVFLKAFRRLASFRRKAKFSTWLYRIAYNTAISAIRKPRLKECRIADTMASEADVEDHTNERQIQALMTAVGRLPPADAALLTLFYTEDRSLEEIGEITGLSLSNVKVRLHRIRHKLREQIMEIKTDDE